MHAIDFMDALLETPRNIVKELGEIGAMTAAEQAGIRDETLRRLAAGEIPVPVAVTILAVVEVEPIAPDLVRLLRSGEASLPSRSAALILLPRTGVDVRRELESLDPEIRDELIDEALSLQNAAHIVGQQGTPFEAIGMADFEDGEVDLDAIIDDLLESFLASPEAAEAADADDLRFWAGELVRLGVDYGHGSPAFWEPATVEELVTEILPRKVTIESEANAAPAIPAFRAFFRWASGVAPVAHAEAIDAFLEGVAARFPAMMMDSSRFGPAKSFVMAGSAAGFDMSTEEGMLAFQQQWNQRQAPPRVSASHRKADAAKKRKAKMAKLSRRKNRRKK